MVWDETDGFLEKEENEFEQEFGEDEDFIEFYDPNEDSWCCNNTDYIEVDISELENIIPIEDIVAIIASYLEDIGKEVYLDDELEENHGFKVISLIGSSDERKIYFK